VGWCQTKFSISGLSPENKFGKKKNLFYICTMKEELVREPYQSTITKELYQYMKDNYHTIDEVKKICDEVVRKKQLEVVSHPRVYIAKTKDPKTDLYYLNCKVFFPISISEKKEVKVYIGRMSDFPLGTKDPNVKKIGTQKMKEKLKEMITSI
jgi:esterase/lipase